MVLEEALKKRIEQAIYDVGKTKVVLNGVLAWLDAADDNLGKEDLIKIMKRCYSDVEINDAKEILKNVVKANQETFRNDKEVDTAMGGQKEPEKREKLIRDIIDLNARLDGANLLPTFLMTSKDLKRNPQLQSPEDDIENVSHKVNMLESCIINLTNKMTEETKALKDEMRNMKPSYADMIRNRDARSNDVSGRNDSEEQIRDQIRDRSNGRKRSRVEDDIINVNREDNDDAFETQGRRGFKAQNGQARTDGNQSNDNQPNRRQSWRSKLPNCVGSGQDSEFAAPVDLFVHNVSKEASGEAIKKHMLENKNLNILEIQKVSHEDARTQSFRVKIKAADYENALKPETWPYRVRVRVYRHFRQKREEGGQFGQDQPRERNQI